MSWSTRAAKELKLDNIDLSVLIKLDNYSEQSGSLVKDVLSLYIETAPKQIQSILDSVEALNTGAAHQTAHSLKSSSAQIGAMKVSEISRQIEELSSSSSTTPEPIKQSAKKLSSHFDKLIIELKSILEIIENSSQSN